ncbi:GntR family transcriptional regulator [Saccharopolyspora spinosa]|uniref:DNA-binding GntR family transcriptional regulator n=1 Tax=Saccharopolyspora spinosa TaxID=60894 RepID=A0A2N3Y5T3_SACSN|nr:GntR family transcriptional regulator [Saccharopolyspora spinosa]PKW18268.1 DNA-binding GntR family transcriptional regulator [Saccharopolyspora spinosa]
MTEGTRGRTNRRAVYETLRRKMLTLELRPGAALSENELAASLGVSRTPVRESLILLSEEGLVQVFPQVGSFVSRVDLRRVADAQFLREAVELAALDDLPADLDGEVVAELEANLARQQEPQIDLEDFFALDEEFHRGLLRLSGHESAWPTVVSAKGHLDRARRLGLYEANSPRVFVDQHVRIFEAVLDQDPPRARETMRAHLREVFADIERIRERSPELFVTNSTATPVRRNVVVWE